MYNRRFMGALGGAAAAMGGGVAAFSARGTDAGDFWGGFVIGLVLAMAVVLIFARGRRSACNLP